MASLRKINRHYDRLHEEIFIRTGVPNPMRQGEPGATVAAYPNGMLHEQIGRWIARQTRRLLRRETAPRS